jgi:hypothetical protein
MLPIILHQNNLRPMYEKWPHGEQAKWWTHAERFDIMVQPEEFRWYISYQYYVVAMLASHVAISSRRKTARSLRMARAEKGAAESLPRGSQSTQ